MSRVKQQMVVDINCDLGEVAGNDAQIMPYISSANIACGYHAGDPTTIWQTIQLASKNGVAVGAHVSFHDKENFGRTEMHLPSSEIYELVLQQLLIIKEIADTLNTTLHHVKPHGAIYNISARDAVVAGTIAKAVKDFDPNLYLFGLSGSHSIFQARMFGLKTLSEVFADRTYQDDGSLTPRSGPDALHDDINKVIQQVLQMVTTGTVTTTSGKQIPILADTICIHGDGQHAASFAKGIYQALEKEGISIKAC